MFPCHCSPLSVPRFPPIVRVNSLGRLVTWSLARKEIVSVQNGNVYQNKIKLNTRGGYLKFNKMH